MLKRESSLPVYSDESCLPAAYGRGGGNVETSYGRAPERYREFARAIGLNVDAA